MQKMSLFWLWMIPALLIATWIGARGLNTDALWFDEYWSVYNAGGAHYGPLSPGGIWERVAKGDPWQAPGYFLLLGGWGALVGWTPFALRVLSLLAGVLSAAWAFRLGRDLTSPLGGLGAAVTMSLSAYFLYFFHEMRTYTLVVMLIAMTAWAYWRAARGGGRWSQLTLLAGAICLLYTHYFAALTLVVIGLYHLVFVKKDSQWLETGLTLGVAGLCFLPWLGVLLAGVNSAAEDTLRQSSAWSSGQALSGLLFMFSNGSLALALLLGAMSLMTSQADAHVMPEAAGQASFPGRLKAVLIFSPVVAFAWLWLLGVLGLLLAINARYGVILEVRYLFPLWPALALVAGTAIHKLGQRGAGGLALLILAVWGAAGVWNSIDARSANSLSNPHWHQPWDALVDELRLRAQDGDALLYLLPDWTWPSYHQLVFDHYLYGLPVRGTLLQRPDNVGAVVFEGQVLGAVEDGERVWLGYTADQPTGYSAQVQALLRGQSLMACGNVSTSPQLNLELYVRANGASGNGCEP